MLTDAAQRKYLQERLEETRYNKPTRYTPLKITVPPTIKKARKIVARESKKIKAWEDRIYKIKEERANDVERAYFKVKDAIMLLPFEKALAVINKFNATKF